MFGQQATELGIDKLGIAAKGQIKLHLHQLLVLAEVAQAQTLPMGQSDFGVKQIPIPVIKHILPIAVDAVLLHRLGQMQQEFLFGLGKVDFLQHQVHKRTGIGAALEAEAVGLQDILRLIDRGGLDFKLLITGARQHPLVGQMFDQAGIAADPPGRALTRRRHLGTKWAWRVVFNALKATWVCIAHPGQGDGLANKGCGGALQPIAVTVLVFNAEQIAYGCVFQKAVDARLVHAAVVGQPQITAIYGPGQRHIQEAQIFGQRLAFTGFPAFVTGVQIPD